MSEIRFYHLQRQRLEDVLPVMLERSYERGARALVLVSAPERAEALAAHLWTYRPERFLPHGTAKDGDPAAQPIYLAPETEKTTFPADSLFLCDGAQHADPGAFALVCELFDGNDDQAAAAARARWRTYKAAGHRLLYYQQDSAGKWQEKTDAADA